MTLISRSFILVGLVCFLAAPAHPDELASSFKQAALLGDAQERNSPTANYFAKVLMPYYGEKYAKVLGACFSTVQNPDSGSFGFVVAIGPDGRILKLYHDKETNILACMRKTLENEVFPAPPVSPYYLHIEMKFADEPESQDAPPLILEPDKYSYTFATPPGWAYSFEQAQQYGVRLVFFPQGGSFDASNSIVYVAETRDCCGATCAGALTSAIAHEIEETKQDSPGVHVAVEKPIETIEGSRAEVRILTGLKDARQPKEALAFIEHKETIVLVVLTTKNPANWDQDYDIFRRIVATHKFVGCDSPNLAVSGHQ